MSSGVQRNEGWHTPGISVDIFLNCPITTLFDNYIFVVTIISRWRYLANVQQGDISLGKIIVLIIKRGLMDSLKQLLIALVLVVSVMGLVG